MFTIGLDNGIRIENIKRSQLPHFIHYPFKTINSNDVEICYWRKCWNIRQSIFDVISKSTNDTEYKYYLTLDNITAIRKELIWWFLHPHEWEHSRTIWTYSEIRRNLLISIWNLGLISNWMHYHPDIKIYFYDSY